MSKRLLLVVALIAASPRALRAQYSDEADSSMTFRPPIAAWASLGLGSGQIHGVNSGSLAVTVRGNVSAGPLLLTYRGSDIGPFPGYGQGVREDGVLVGVRTGGHHLFVSSALGYTAVGPYQSCDACGAERVSPRVSALAYDLMAHAAYIVAGLDVSLSGAIGPSRVTYSAFTVGLELGWLGR
jgi:hypothetical protein